MTWSNQLLFLYKPMILISVNFCSVVIYIYRLYYPILITRTIHATKLLITGILLYFRVDLRAWYTTTGKRRVLHTPIHQILITRKTQGTEFLITSILLYYLVDDRALYKVIGGRRDIHSLISSSSGLSLHISSTISNENVFFIFKGKLLHAFLLLFLKLQKENQVKMNQYNKKTHLLKTCFFQQHYVDIEKKPT